MATKYRRVPRRIWVILIAVVLIFVVGSIIVTKVYNQLLSPASNVSNAQIITIKTGSSVRQISDLLASSHLVRSSWATQLYINTKGLNSALQAGTYSISPNLSTQQIINIIASGRISTKLVTILPGVTIFKLKSDLINAGYTPSEVSSALNPANYVNLPIFTLIPKSVPSLEGLLWPDSFERNSDTPLSQIITESLNEMTSQLTLNVQQEFASEGLSTYQGLTLTSIIDQEVSNPTDQTQVAQVFLSRLKQGMNLGSDVTANYGALLNNQPPNLSYDSPYNTLLHTGLPPTPISTISKSSLYAATHPSSTNWLYFVTGDNGTTYFSTTLQQQQANTAQYCHKLCSGS